jgi:phosphopantothenoylcysteine decarboxylase/phosphopantothenate--cysteine ligase
MFRRMANVRVSPKASRGTKALRDRPKLLLTAGPTHEPIDAVRFLGNRSSGRLGIAIADEAAARGWDVTLLLGPTPLRPRNAGVRVCSYRSCADLEALLDQHFQACGLLIMAAAVSDYRPDPAGVNEAEKRRRTADDLVLRLVPTPDLLAGCASRRRSGQLLVGFALEPADMMIEKASAKRVKKGIDFIVANPLETMESATIDATLIGDDGVVARTDAHLNKTAFGGWLLDRIEPLLGVAGRDAAGREETCRATTP